MKVNFYQIFKLCYKQFSNKISNARHSGPDCKKYSSNSNGPCINGGKLTCKGDEVAPNIICECPLNYKGMFCEEKSENVSIFPSLFAPLIDNIRIQNH